MDKKNPDKRQEKQQPQRPTPQTGNRPTDRQKQPREDDAE